MPGLREREHADEDEARVRDGRVREEALDVGLGHREDGADDHGEGRDDDQAHLPVPAVRADADVGEPQDRPERGDLRAGRHEPGHRGRRTLVDVRDPGVERHRTDLEQQAHHGEDDPRDQEPVEVTGCRGDGGRDRLEVAGPGIPVEECGTEEQERAGESAEEEVLQGRLLGEQAAAPSQTGHDVQRQGEHLEADEHRDEVVRGDEHHHAQDREEREGEDLGRRIARPGGRVLLRRARRRGPHRREGVGSRPRRSAPP